MVSFQKWSGPTSLSLYFSTRNCSLARCAQYSAVVVPATPNDGPFPQPWVLHFLLLMSTISPGARCAQYTAVFVPASPNDGAFTQPWVLHFLLLTLTIPSGVCCAQYSLFLYLQLRTTAPEVFGSALYAADVDHSVRCVLCTVLRRSCTCHSKPQPLSANLGSAFHVLDVDHPVRCVLCTVLRRFCICHSERWDLDATFGSVLLAADVNHSDRCVLCTILCR